ncbi:MAG TPA: universal stress protein [Solirubrobacteraceae bacterium]|nr:universal stress protein [Solirubrobacteraceae bacterium]
MFENVIVGVDGRPNGRDAIALASRLIGSAGKLTLANVHPGASRPVNATEPEMLTKERTASHELLEAERSRAEVEAELVSYASGSPGRGLHDLAEETSADLLVVGSCSRGPVGRVLLGDDTRGALNGAPCAVAVATRGYAEHPHPIATVGVGYDGSPESDIALAKARELAAGNRSLVRVLEVVNIPNYAFTGFGAPALGESIEMMISEADDRLAKLEGVEGRAVYGISGEELAAFGDEVQLLVVGSRGYGPMKRLIVGSTSDYLQRHARCSLLVLPRAAAEGDEGDDGNDRPGGVGDGADTDAGAGSASAT